MYRNIRHNPEGLDQTGGGGIATTPPEAIPEVWGLKRIQDEEVGKLIPDDKYFTSMERATTSNIKTLPYINEIINRVAEEMEALGFEDTGTFSKNSIPTVDNALRTKKEQKRLFDAKVAEVKADNPNLTDKQAKAKADDMVANPSGWRAPTPHMTGRAVDFNLLIPGTTEMNTDFENCMKMWNSYKWKVFNHLLQNRYKVMNLLNEPWHYEFGLLADENMIHIKALEKDGKTMVAPQIPEYLKDKTKINVELARTRNVSLGRKFPYPTDFDIGTADFAFYVGHLQKKMRKKVTGIFDASTAEGLKKLILKKEPMLEVKYNKPQSFPLPLLKSNVDAWVDEFDFSSFFTKTAVASLVLGGAYYLFNKKNKRE